jgi:transposase
MPPIAPADVVVGVDTHKPVHAATALSGLGARLGTITVPASAEGYRDLEAWACSFGAVHAFGIEGTGSYGAGLARALAGRGHAVIEVNRPNRQLRPSRARATRSMPRAPPVPCWAARPRPARRAARAPWR